MAEKPVPQGPARRGASRRAASPATSSESTPSESSSPGAAPTRSAAPRGAGERRAAAEAARRAESPRFRVGDPAPARPDDHAVGKAVDTADDRPDEQAVGQAVHGADDRAVIHGDDRAAAARKTLSHAIGLPDTGASATAASRTASATAVSERPDTARPSSAARATTGGSGGGSRRASRTAGPRGDSPVRARTPRGARILAIVVAVVLAFHFLLTYTWSTSSIALRSLIGTDLLTNYMTPMFQQGWAVFAPNPGSTNVSLEVRALLPASGSTPQAATDWFSITGSDTNEFVRGHLAPSRMYLSNYILGDRFHGAFLALNPNVRELVGNDYYGDDWLTRLKADLTATPDPWADNYIEYETTVTGLATAIAKARWGDGIIGVQVRTVATAAKPFEQRFDDSVVIAPTYFIEGWRQPLDVAGLDTSAITDFYGGGQG